MNEVQQDYKEKGKGFISVCAYCFPGTSIFEKFPELAGSIISHGICPDCAKIMLQELENTLQKGPKVSFEK